MNLFFAYRYLWPGLALVLFNISYCPAQTVLSLDSALAKAYRVHPQLKLNRQEMLREQALRRGSFSLPNPSVWTENPTGERFVGGVQQDFEFPGVYVNQSKLAKETIKLAQQSEQVSRNDITRNVRAAYLNLQFAEGRVKQLHHLDSLFSRFAATAVRRFGAGDAGLIEKVSAELSWKEVSNQVNQAKMDLVNAQRQLQLLTGIGNKPIRSSAKLVKAVADLSSEEELPDGHPQKAYYQQSFAVAERTLKLEKSRAWPGLMVAYLNQVGADAPIRTGMQFGLTLPIWFWTHSARIKGARTGVEIAKTQSELTQLTLNSQWQQSLAEYKKAAASLAFYETDALKQAAVLADAAQRSFDAGEVGYVGLLQSLQQAAQTQMSYLEALRNYNQSIIELNYLKGQ